jgi:hypothetical protein
MLIWKIAWRNLWRHQSKSLIVGVILFAGALLMTVGNALLDGALQGLEENTVNRMTGHLVVTSVDQTDKDLFFAPEPVAERRRRGFEALAEDYRARFARTIAPAHTPLDGDTIFALATGETPGEPDVTRIGALAESRRVEVKRAMGRGLTNPDISLALWANRLFLKTQKEHPKNNCGPYWLPNHICVIG